MRSTAEVRRSSSVRFIPRQSASLNNGAEDFGSVERRSCKFSSIFAFAIVSGISGALVNAIFTFFPSVMTTLEKRFSINNQTLSYVLLANDISAIFIGPFTTYYLSKRHIPRSLCFALLMMMVYSFIIASPHYIYGSGETAMSFVDNPNITDVVSSSVVDSSKLCNFTLTEVITPLKDPYFWVLVIFFCGHFFCGIADSIFWCLLLTYLDNNVSKARAPMVHSLSMVIRFFGILLGNTMNNWGLQVYINPFVTPTIDYKDPRWIGAWWFTPTILGFLFIIPAVLMTRFPESLREKERHEEELKGIPLEPENEVDLPNQQEVVLVQEKPSIKDLKATLKRLLRNKVVFYTIFAYIARRFAGLPFNTYMVKYMEQLYNVATADANGYIAKYDTPSLIAGVMMSGFLTTKLKPSARQLQAFSMFVAFLLALSTLGYIYYSCDRPGLEAGSLGSSECAQGCLCDNVKFSPICGSDGKTYSSPCEAGCLTLGGKENGTKIFSNCSCIRIENLSGNVTGGTARDGPCKSELCVFPLYFFLATQATTNFLAACTWTTSTIITFRSVEPRDKAIVLVLFEIVGSVFVSIPGPLILSRLLDKLCIRWDEPSDPNSHCWIYDRKLFSYFFNGSSAALIFISIFFGSLVWRHLKNVEIFDKKDNDVNEDEGLQGNGILSVN